MSWDSYIDNLLGHAAGNADKACIIGSDGSKWTTDGHGSVSTQFLSGYNLLMCLTDVMIFRL